MTDRYEALGGVPVEEIARVAGHKQTSTTELVYRRELRPVITTGAEIMYKVSRQSERAIPLPVCEVRSGPELVSQDVEIGFQRVIAERLGVREEYFNG